MHRPWILIVLSTFLASASHAKDSTIAIDWAKSTGVSTTELTIQVCPEPPMRRGGIIHRQTHDALRDLKMNYARLQPWFPYPRLSIAALDAPANGKTSWNFSLIDPIVLDFYEAAQGRPIVLNMAIPGWLFKGTPPTYPDDPNAIHWQYEFGPDISRELRDPTYREVADYFRRVAEWYIKGGFTDEYGKEHRSGHRLKIDYWEVLNEQDQSNEPGMSWGHELTPDVYTKLYDEVVTQLRPLDPAMKFSGLALQSLANLHYFEYFLNARNHKPGIPLDMVSYHLYIRARAGATAAEWQSEMYADADRWVRTVRKIESIRKRLSPGTKTFISEFGFMWGPEFINSLLVPLSGGKSNSEDPDIPPEYWHLSASIFGYVFLGATRAGVDLMAAAELVDYPGQLAGTNLIHWRTGEPNAVYRVVKLLHEQLPPGSRLIKTEVSADGVEAQAFETSQGRKLLVINKTAEERALRVPGIAGARSFTVDRASGFGLPRVESQSGEDLRLGPQAVRLLAWNPNSVRETAERRRVEARTSH